MSYLSYMSYVMQIIWVMYVGYMIYMGYVSHMSIFMNHIKSKRYFSQYKRINLRHQKSKN